MSVSVITRERWWFVLNDHDREAWRRLLAEHGVDDLSGIQWFTFDHAAGVVTLYGELDQVVATIDIGPARVPPLSADGD